MRITDTLVVRPATSEQPMRNCCRCLCNSLDLGPFVLHPDRAPLESVGPMSFRVQSVTQCFILES
jgi:hypothetical protein